MNRRLLVAVLVVVASSVSGCGGSSSGDSSAESDPTEELCSIAIEGLALGLEQYERTEVVGEILGAASDAMAIPCRNAISNLQAGRPMTFELLRPTAEPLTLSVDLATLTMPPPPVPPPGSSAEVQQRWSSCWSSYSVSNWMVDLCLRGDIDPLGP